MINIIADRVGPFVGIASQSMASATVVGDYVPYTKHNTWTCNIGSVAAGKTVVFAIKEATTKAGAGASTVEDQDGSTTATATYTGRARATELSILIDTPTAGKTVVLITPRDTAAVTYTAAAATDVAAKEFLNAAGLVACINANQSTLIASASGTDVTVKLADQYMGGYITESGVQETAAVVTTAVSGMLRISVASDAFQAVDDYIYAAPSVTTDATIVCGVTLEREANRCPDTGNCAYDVRIK